MYSRIITTSLAIAAALGPLSAAASSNGADIPSRVVSYGDLNLESHEGISRLYSRIKSAAKEVCEPAVFSVTSAYLLQARCQERAVVQAVADVRSTRLMTLHMALTGRVDPAQPQ
jgi:UrcA family protein